LIRIIGARPSRVKLKRALGRGPLREKIAARQTPFLSIIGGAARLAPALLAKMD